MAGVSNGLASSEQSVDGEEHGYLLGSIQRRSGGAQETSQSLQGASKFFDGLGRLWKS
jgi:hypothetical protein